MYKRVNILRSVPYVAQISLFVAYLVVANPLFAEDKPSSSISKSSSDKTSDKKIDWLKVPVLDPIKPPKAELIEQSLKRGVQYLLNSQNKNGSWGSPTNTKQLNIYAPVPGAHHAFRMGATSLALAALIELEPEYPDSTASIDRAEKWMLEYLPKLRRATPTAIYNVWGHAYSIQALAHMHHRHSDSAEWKTKIEKLIESQFDMLSRYESVDGGWGYYDFRYGTKRPSSSSISFVSATALVSFAEAREIGMTPPKKVIDRAVASLHRQRKKDFSYMYGEYLKTRPMYHINRPGGSLGRSQACNLALRLWGDDAITNDVIVAWLNRLFSRNGWLDIGRKRPIPHESWFAVAGYFYYFGHYYAALSFDQIPESQRPELQAHMAKLMLDRQEKDGSWWDYPLYAYHQPYGTGFALMTLSRCREKTSYDVPLLPAVSK